MSLIVYLRKSSVQLIKESRGRRLSVTDARKSLCIILDTTSLFYISTNSLFITNTNLLLDTKTSSLFNTNTNLVFKQIQNILFANDNHPRFTNPAKKLWRNPTGNHDLSVGNLVRRMTNMS